MGVIYSLLDHVKPDFVMLSGDLVSGQAARCHYPNLKDGCYLRVFIIINFGYQQKNINLIELGAWYITFTINKNSICINNRKS